MTKRKGYLAILFILLAVVGCSPGELFGAPSRNEIENFVKTEMQKQFDTDPTFSQHSMKVTSVIVVEKTKGSYDGVAEVLFRKNSHRVLFEVTVDTERMLYQSKPDAFVFVDRAVHSDWQVMEDRRLLFEDAARNSERQERSRDRFIQENERQNRINERNFSR